MLVTYHICICEVLVSLCGDQRLCVVSWLHGGKEPHLLEDAVGDIAVFLVGGVEDNFVPNIQNPKPYAVRFCYFKRLKGSYFLFWPHIDSTPRNLLS